MIHWVAMIAAKADTPFAIVSGFCVIGMYCVYFWRVFLSNQGNKFIECGTLTLIVFFAMVPFSKIPGFRDRIPNWVFASWIILLLVLCFTTLFFLLLRAIRAGIRADQHPKRK